MDDSQTISIKSKQNNRNQLIDLLRFVAASIVAIYHFNEPIPYITNTYRDICKLGFLGVPIFFVISGYCIKIAQDNSNRPKEFIIRRLFRIMPPYWFSCSIVISLAIFLKLLTGTNSIPIPLNFKGILATICLYTYPLSDFKTINWVYWTLPFELFFYFIVFFLMFLPNKIRIHIYILLASIALVLPIQTGNVLFFFNELPNFMLGYSFYSLINKKVDFSFNLILFVLSIIGIFVKHPAIEYVSVSLVVCILIFINQTWPLKNNFFSRLGDYSYSLYLIHVPIGIYLLGFVKFTKIVQTNEILNILVDLSLLILLVFISKSMFENVEIKSIKIGKRLTKSVDQHLIKI